MVVLRQIIEEHYFFFETFMLSMCTLMLVAPSGRRFAFKKNKNIDLIQKICQFSR